MRHTVLGGLGFIGSHLVDALVKAGDDVLVIDDGRTAAIKPRESAAPVTPFDVALSGHYTSDMVWHLASPVGSARMTSGADVLNRIVRETAAVVEGARFCNARVVAFSTCEVYGSHSFILNENSMLKVQPPFTPRSEYQLGKIAMECMLFNSGLPVQIIRPENVVGPRQQAAGGFVMARFREQLRRGEPLTVFRPGTQHRSFMHVNDLISFCMMLRSKKQVWKQNRAWNVAAPLNNISIKQLACRLSKDVRMVDGKTAIGPEWRDVDEKILNIEQAERIGWQPKVTLKQIIEEVLHD